MTVIETETPTMSVSETEIPIIPEDKEKRAEYLQKIEAGLLVSEEDAEMIVTDTKTLIVKDIEFMEALDTPVYIIGSNRCHALVYITNIHMINAEEFEATIDMHKITTEQKLERWGDKPILFAYHFVIMERYDYPKLVAQPSEKSEFVKNIDFILEHNDDADIEIIVQKVELFEKFKPMTAGKKFENFGEAAKFIFNGD